tara:strand:+ start:1021 stop:1710 length:690 start_codon:yes stop_codon:yes gene_type:complete
MEKHKVKKKIKIHAFIQARQTSIRLPNKIFLRLNNLSILENIFLRLKNSKILENVFFIIPSNSKNLKLKRFLKKKNYQFFCGPELNVLNRFYKASQKFKSEIIVRITADCPLVDYRLMDKMLIRFLENKSVHYLSNTLKRSYPDGLDIEIFSKKALKIANIRAKNKYDLEHVTPYIKRNFKCLNFLNNKDFSRLRWTLDTAQDYNKLSRMFLKNKINPNLSWKKILNKV